MDSIDLPALEARARSHYEKSRLRRALAGALPVFLVVGAALFFARHATSVGLFGGASFVTGVTLLWRGQSAGRAFWPGVLAGLLPLVLSLIANQTHGCAMGHCSTWCVPACAAGGVVAGLYIAALTRRWKLGASFWVGASLMAVLTGSMGCACIGASGVFALIAGHAIGVSPALLKLKSAH
ncbi:MAG: hypothetical protein ACO1OB_28855 [Archangium sp.]